MRRNLPLAFLLSFVLSLVPAAPSRAETIELKSGEIIEGAIVAKDPTHTKVRVKYGTVLVNNQDIAAISSAPPPPQDETPDAAALAEEAISAAADPAAAPPVTEKPAGPVLMRASDEITLEEIEKRAVLYFWEQSDPQTGLVRDRSNPDAPASIAACGFGLAALCIGAERGWLEARAVRERVQAMLSFFKDRAEQQHGFFYHFLDMNTGRRTWSSEISSIDNALLMAGILFAGQYYRDSVLEKQANMLFNRVDWPWMLNGQETFCLEWKPESGFSNDRWNTYAEHILLYILAMGSPTHPVSKKSWKAWRREFKTYKSYTYVHNSQESLFVYLFSQAWLDFRNKRDGKVNYWTNTTQAIKANRKFCQDNKKYFKTYETNIWGLSETDGPSGYKHYGATEKGHDGTIAPYAMIASIPFVPSLAQDGVHAMARKYAGKIWGPYGFTSGFNKDRKWYSTEYVGIHLGLTALMLDNYYSGFVWKTMMENPVVREGMRKAKL